MSAITKISFRNIESSDELVELIAARARKLRRISPELVTCQITVEQPHANHNTGNECLVVLRVGLPGMAFVGRALEKGALAERLPVAIGAAFRSVERQILGHGSRRESGRRRGVPRYGRSEPGRDAVA